ncbi:MAG TPA: hypothetical protein VMF62_06570 [Acetobacteraceae bacterium]|nr:hypothetical protein [Acetobacteraceae bacterium]
MVRIATFLPSPVDFPESPLDKMPIARTIRRTIAVDKVEDFRHARKSLRRLKLSGKGGKAPGVA